MDVSTDVMNDETSACCTSFFKVSSWFLMKANIVNLVHERSICGPQGYADSALKSTSQGGTTRQLCANNVRNKLEIFVVGPTYH